MIPALPLQLSNPNNAPGRPGSGAKKVGAGGQDANSLEQLSLAAGRGQSLYFHRSRLKDFLFARKTVGNWVAIVGQSLARFSEEISLQTSESTADPRIGVHAITALEEKATALAHVIGVRARVAAAVPYYRIDGFIFTTLLPGAMDPS